MGRGGCRGIPAEIPPSGSCFSAPFNHLFNPLPPPWFYPGKDFCVVCFLHPARLLFCVFFLPTPTLLPPTVFPDRNLTHAFLFFISMAYFVFPLFLPSVFLFFFYPPFFLPLVPQEKRPPSRWDRMTVLLEFPVPALPKSAQLLSWATGGFGMVCWQRQGD